MSGALTDTSILAGASQAAGYDIDYSCRYNVGDSPILKRDVTVAGNRRTSTWSAWVKIGWNTFSRDDGTVVPYYVLFCCGNSDGRWNVGFSNATAINNNLPQLMIAQVDSGGSQAFEVSSNQAFRDPAAWYHIMVVMDTTQATNTNRVKAYINGERITDWGVTQWPNQNYDSDCFRTADPTVRVRIGNTTNSSNTGANFWNGYISEVHVVDGQALLPSSFGELDEDTNEWKAIKYAGTYGTNGFYLDFSDSAALGTDTSGEGNNLTVSGLAATDQMIDTPQNSTGSNFATLNPLVPLANSSSTFPTLSEGNLKWSGANPNYYSRILGTIPITSGKWYWEVYNKDITSISWTEGRIGIFSMKSLEEFGSSTTASHDIKGTLLYSAWNGKLEAGNGTGTPDTLATLSTYTNGDIIGIAVDMDSSTILLYKNGTVQNSGTAIAFSAMSQPNGIADGAIPWFNAIYSQHSRVVNFGQDSSFAANKTAQGNTDTNDCGDFYYTPPSGYLAVCSNNLADPSIALPGENFNTVLYTGTGSELAVTGVGFQPDFTWIKTRTLTYNHRVFDVARGVTRELYPNDTDAEVTNDAQTLKSFDSDGFTLGTSSGVNPTSTMVSWNWKAGGAAVSNTDGTITTSVSANTTVGFSIGTSTVGSTGTYTFGHGLSTTPELIIMKGMSGINSWQTQDATNGATKTMLLDGTNAAYTSGAWGSTSPTASVFTANIAAGTYVAYCFHSIEGFSKIGKYVSNNSTNGPFLYLGFTPAFIMLKCYDATDNWNLYDNKRNGFNGTGGTYQLRADANAAGFTSAATMVDLVSNGMKIRTSDPGTNGSGRNYIYIAFAENPFKTTRAR